MQNRAGYVKNPILTFIVLHMPDKDFTTGDVRNAYNEYYSHLPNLKTKYSSDVIIKLVDEGWLIRLSHLSSKGHPLYRLNMAMYSNNVLQFVPNGTQEFLKAYV